MKAWTSQDKVFFYHQLLSMLRAQMPLDRAMELIAGRHPTPKLRQAVETMAASLREGRGLSDLMKEREELFTSYEAGVVGAGEEFDNLTESLEWLAELNQKESDRARTVSVVYRYSQILFAVTFFILAVMFIKVIPVFEKMYLNMEMDLPGLTRLVLNISHGLNNNLIWVMVVTAVVVVFIWYARRRYPEKISMIVTHLPLFGASWMYLEAVRFAWVAGRALEAGVEPRKAIDSSADFISHPYLRGRLKTMSAMLEEGGSWATALASIRRFPDSIIAFVKLGEVQGELGMALLEAWRSQSRQVADESKWMAIMEPLFIILVGFSVGSIAVAIYLPIFSMTGGFF